MSESMNFGYIEYIREQQKIYNEYDLIRFMESGSNYKKDGALNRIINMLKQVISSIRKTISDMLESIGNKMAYGAMSKSKKNQYDNFVAWAEENPSVKSKSITVKDWNRINREYEQIEKKIASSMKEGSVDSAGLTVAANKMIANMDSVLKSTSAVITVDAAMAFARKSPKIAKDVQSCLNSNKALLANIEDQLGEKDAIKLQKKINRLTKETTYQKIMAVIIKKKEESFNDVLNNYVESLSRLQGPIDKVKSTVAHRSGIVTAAKVYTKDKKTRDGIKDIKVFRDEISQGTSTLKEFLNPTVR